MLKAQDTLVLLKIQSVRTLEPPKEDDDVWTKPEFLLRYSVLGTSIGISTSQGFEAVKRLIEARLLDEGMHVRKRATAEWLIYGVKYFLPAKFGGLTRGMPTSHAAPPLKSIISELVPGQEPPPVWPNADGIRGISFEPIYKTAPLAAERDAKLYKYLALLDAIRAGRVRESAMAVEIFRQELESR